MDYTYEDIAKMIDHALLAPTLPMDQLEAGCVLARQYNVASVCVTPYFVPRCAELLADTDVVTSTVIGFPLGGHATSTKLREAETAIDDGCLELDMVVNVSQVLSENWDYVKNDIHAVIQAAHAAGRRVKVIFENCYLQDSHQIRLVEICNELNADWIKTSTGFGTGGATMDDLKLMCEHARDDVQVKAAGGVRDLDTLLNIRELGVTRIGTSGTVKLLEECRTRLQLDPIAEQIDSSSSAY